MAQYPNKTVYGQVKSISARPVTSKKTGKEFKAYSVRLDTGDEFDIGLNTPTFGVGTMVKAELEHKYGKWNAVQGNTQVSSVTRFDPSALSDAPQPAAKTGGGARNTTGFPISKRDGQFSIIRQNSLTHAVNVWRGLLESRPSALPSGAASGDPSATTDFIIDLAHQFADFSSGQMEVKHAREMQNQMAAQQAQSDDDEADAIPF